MEQKHLPKDSVVKRYKEKRNSTDMALQLDHWLHRGVDLAETP